VYCAPFDVRFPNPDNHEQTFTVVQPDICVVCDKNKLDKRGCMGAPDIIVEVLALSTSKKDLKEKYQLYEAYGVREYWVVFPAEHVIVVYATEQGLYIQRERYVSGDTIKTDILPGLRIMVDDVFED
jgi:Uma2 family endonuclease